MQTLCWSIVYWSRDLCTFLFCLLCSLFNEPLFPLGFIIVMIIKYVRRHRNSTHYYRHKKSTQNVDTKYRHKISTQCIPKSRILISVGISPKIIYSAFIFQKILYLRFSIQRDLSTTQSNSQDVCHYYRTLQILLTKQHKKNRV